MGQEKDCLYDFDNKNKKAHSPVVQFDAVKSVVVKIKALQLQGQQVWERQELQTLKHSKLIPSKFTPGTLILHQLWLLGKDPSKHTATH